MIDFGDKSKCCGCSACVAACPKDCLKMEPDAEGFLYAKASNAAACIQCGLCEKVCPMRNASEFPLARFAYAAIAGDEKALARTSSGGGFYVLAKDALESEGEGVVFGAAWDKSAWRVVQKSADSLEGLEDFLGSKCVQSDPKDTLAQAQTLLNSGRRVLYSGTPCQINALNLFLRKKYDNLTTAAVACHSVPSPAVWSVFLENCRRKNSDSAIRNIRFRKKYDTKYYGKSCMGFAVETDAKESKKAQNYWSTPFGRAFIGDLISRPSCADCPAKESRCSADFIIADFWGANFEDPSLNPRAGLSAILPNSPKAEETLERLAGKFSLLRRFPYEAAAKHNERIRRARRPNKDRDKFFAEFARAPNPQAKYKVLLKWTTPPLRARAKTALKRCIRAVLCELGLWNAARKLAGKK